MTIPRTWMGSVIPPANVAVPLLQLLLAAATTNYPLPGFNPETFPSGVAGDATKPFNPGATGLSFTAGAAVADLFIEFDIANSGAANLYIGGPTVSPTNCGRHLVPSGFQDIGKATMPLVNLADIFLYCDTASMQINVTIQTDWRNG